jgi:hypothetical protein
VFRRRIAHGKHRRHHSATGNEISARDLYPYSASFYMAAYREYQISVAAINSQASMSDRERSSARIRLFEQRSRARWALAARGAESLPFAVQMLRSSDAVEREDGRALLGLVAKEENAPDILVGMLADSEDSELSCYLVTLLGEQPIVRTLSLLMAVVSDPDTAVGTKQAAREALTLLSSPPDDSEVLQENPGSISPELDQEVLEISVTRVTELRRTVAG